MVRWMHEFGSNFDYQCKIGYDSVLSARIKQIKTTKKLFHVKFGINLESDPDAIINSIANQVQNLPNDLDNLVIPTGSAITAGGILCGLKKYNIKPKKIIIVQISGFDRRNTIRKILDLSNVEHPYPQYQYVADKTYPYSKHLNVNLNNTENLDPVYEAKGYNWMIKNVDYKNEKTLFWIVGNSLYFRTITPEILLE